MSIHLDFITSSSHFGLPFFDGDIPKRTTTIEQVRVDGRPITFVDDTVPSRLLDTIRTGREVERALKEQKWGRKLLETLRLARMRIEEPVRPKVFNCFNFAAGMRGMDMTGRVDVVFPDPEYPVGCSDFPERNVVIGQGFSDILVTDDHVLFPAPTIGEDGEQESSYLHKLGDRGPICLSGLSVAMNIYQARKAYEIDYAKNANDGNDSTSDVA